MVHKMKQNIRYMKVVYIEGHSTLLVVTKMMNTTDEIVFSPIFAHFYYLIGF